MDPGIISRHAGISKTLKFRKEKRSSLNFEKYAGEGNRFINDVASELNCSNNTAARVTKSVLHAIRDRLPPDDAIEFAQGLPMALKGVFIDQYDISNTPVVIRHAEDFLDFIYSKNQCARQDFPDTESVEDALIGVINVLSDYMDRGQVAQVKHIMGNELTDLINGVDHNWNARYRHSYGR